VLRLEWALDFDADVPRLFIGKFGQMSADAFQVKPGDLLIEVLGQHIDLVLIDW
jgi:hypothetical protein